MGEIGLFLHINTGSKNANCNKMEEKAMDHSVLTVMKISNQKEEIQDCYIQLMENIPIF